MPSISFDPVAYAYDRTCGRPTDCRRPGAGAQVEGHLLDVGVGTGRIGLPLASLGYRYTGVDIAEKMLAQLEQKALARGWQAGGQAWGRWAGEDPARVCPVRRFTHSEPAAMLAW